MKTTVRLALGLLASMAVFPAAAGEAHKGMSVQVTTAINDYGLQDIGRGDFRTAYPWRLADHLTGRWVAVFFLSPQGAPADDVLTNDCNRSAVRINANDPYNIRLVEHPDEDAELELSFASQGGMFYQMQSSVADVERTNHYDASNPANRMSLVDTMKFMTGPVILLRSGEDVLIVEPPGRDPTIYVRCPA